MPTVPPKPTRPEPPSKPAGTSWLAVFLALFVVIVSGIVLFVLTLGAAGILVAVAAGVFAFIGFQYLLWGRWLGPMIQRDEQARLLAQASEGEPSAADGPVES